MADTSAGILLYRREPELQVLIGRIGGPFWAGRREHNWSIPKGEFGAGETALQAARREFREELGLDVPDVTLLDLGTVTQRGGKKVQVFAGEGEIDLAAVVLGTFELEWPRGSGSFQHFPELAEVRWMAARAARECLVSAQAEFVDRLVERSGLRP
jgi:predicted NUDIX family NTP pyrophosphohydrolase